MTTGVILERSTGMKYIGITVMMEADGRRYVPGGDRQTPESD